MAIERRAAGTDRARVALGATAWVFVACLAVQLYLVGLDVVGELETDLHRTFAYVYGWLTPVLVLLAVAARVPPSVGWLAVALVVLFAAEVALPAQRETSAVLAALHPPLAIAIVVVALALARRARPDGGWAPLVRASLGRKG